MSAPPSIASRKATTELKKLELEVELLKREKRWFWLRLPVLTIIVAAVGIFVTVWQFQRTELARIEERREKIQNETAERTNKIQEQIKADRDLILEFGSNDKVTPAKVASLIDDLKSLTKQLPKQRWELQGWEFFEGSTKPGQAEATAKDGVTESLRQVAWGLHYDDRSHPDFDVAALRWEGYKQYWITFFDSHQLFLRQTYLKRLEALYQDEPLCLEKLDYEKETTILSFTNANKTCNEELISAVIYGFREHLRVMKAANQADLLQREVDDFGKLIKNAEFAKKFSNRL